MVNFCRRATATERPAEVPGLPPGGAAGSAGRAAGHLPTASGDRAQLLSGPGEAGQAGDQQAQGAEDQAGGEQHPPPPHQHHHALYLQLWSSLSSTEIWRQLVAETRKAGRDHAALAEIYSGNIMVGALANFLNVATKNNLNEDVIVQVRCTTLHDDITRIYKKCREIGFEIHEEVFHPHSLYAIQGTGGGGVGGGGGVFV